MLFHEVADLQVCFIDFPCFGGPSPRGAFSSLWGFSSFSWVSLILGGVASLFVADEAFAVPHMLCSFTWGEIDSVHVHGIRIPGRSGSPGVLSQ